MAIPTEHRAIVVPGSVKSSAVEGVEFIVRCCGKHEKSVHIEHPGKHTQEELLRIRDQHLLDVAQEHANHEAAIEFLSKAIASPRPAGIFESRQSEVSRTADSSLPEESGDCGCGKS